MATVMKPAMMLTPRPWIAAGQVQIPARGRDQAGSTWRSPQFVEALHRSKGYTEGIVSHSMLQQNRTVARTYQLKVMLCAVAPSIWRRFQVRGDMRLSELHRVLQAVMGWTDSHRYKFEIAGVDYGPPDAEAIWGNRNDRKARLDKVANSTGTAITYHYDFANGWEHAIVVEAILASKPGAKYPVCITGEHACPPEDCGGRPGYASLLSALRGPDRPQHSAMLERFGDTFDPDAFDLPAINLRLMQLPSPTR